MLKGTRPWIDGTMGGPDQLMELLALHLHRLGGARAKTVVFASDGVPWIWNRLAWVEKRVGLDPKRIERVLDTCHATHHISLALKRWAFLSPSGTRGIGSCVNSGVPVAVARWWPHYGPWCRVSRRKRRSGWRSPSSRSTSRTCVTIG